jgi:hypothetical protein
VRASALPPRLNQKQNKGVLGGKNLVILCEYHHRLWGDHLSRARILSSLEAAPAIRRFFPRDAEGKDLHPRDGLLAEVRLDVAPFVMKLYFTKEHAAAWLAGAAQQPEPEARAVSEGEPSAAPAKEKEDA